jgi:hypothetical protein
MTARLREIHNDPQILDRAIAARENLEIVSQGSIAATLIPAVVSSREDARKTMREMFASPAMAIHSWDSDEP